MTSTPINFSTGQLLPVILEPLNGPQETNCDLLEHSLFKELSNGYEKFLKQIIHLKKTQDSQNQSSEELACIQQKTNLISAIVNDYFELKKTAYESQNALIRINRQNYYQSLKSIISNVHLSLMNDIELAEKEEALKEKCLQQEEHRKIQQLIAEIKNQDHKISELIKENQLLRQNVCIDLTKEPDLAANVSPERVSKKRCFKKGKVSKSKKRRVC